MTMDGGSIDAMDISRDGWNGMQWIAVGFGNVFGRSVCFDGCPQKQS
jgi:hypothetical protein